MAEGETVKIVVTGNCQARPIASLLSGFPNIEVLDVIVLHLSNESQACAHQETMATADIIVAQQTVDSFSPQHLSSSQLRASGKAVIWPNIFFCGQQPFLNYVTSPTNGRLLGPLDVYHDIRIMELWHKDRFGTALFDEKLDEQRAAHFAEHSMRELVEREQFCDITITEKINAEWEMERLFFTFNHPSKSMLIHAATQIAKRLSLPVPLFEDAAREPLDKIIPPSIFDLESDPSQPTYQGVDGLGGVTKRNFSWGGLVEASFDAYDRQQEFIVNRDFRLTPSYP